jgi:hypothetical protein
MIKKFSLCLMLLLLSGAYLIYSEEADEAESSSETVYSGEDSDYDEGNEGVQFDFGGKIESVHGVGFLKNFDYLASRNFVSGFVQMSLYGSSAKISATAEYNYANKERTGFRLNEAYYKYSNSIFELCIGRQHVVWGQADGFTLTNVIAAKDSREITSVTNDDSLLPSDGIRLKFFHDIFTFDAMVIPFFTPNKLPPFSFELGKNKPPLYIDLPTEQKESGFKLPISYKKEEAKTPRHVLDTEMGMRFSFFLPRIDFSFSGFYGWDKNPMFVREGVLNAEKKQLLPPPALPMYIPKSIDVNITPEYYRIAMVGTDGAIPIGDVLLRYEAAYVWGRYFEAKKQLGKLPALNSEQVALPFNKPLRKHQLLMLAGLDWNRSGWTFSAQYFEDLILDHKDDIARPLHQGTISLNLSKTFLRETLKLGVTGAIGVNYGDTFSTYSIDYAITDNLHIATGFDIYTKGKDGKGQFSQMKDLNTYWLRGRFSF